MAIAVKFGIFTKRPNSTKVATDEDFTVEYQGVLKDNTDLLSPEIRVLMPNNSQSPVLFNYAFIPSFIRYYFVTNWRLGKRVLETLLSLSYALQVSTMALFLTCRKCQRLPLRRRL